MEINQDARTLRFDVQEFQVSINAKIACTSVHPIHGRYSRSKPDRDEVGRDDKKKAIYDSFVTLSVLQCGRS